MTDKSVKNKDLATGAVTRQADGAEQVPCPIRQGLRAEYLDLRPALKGLLIRRTRDFGASEDLLQDMWLKLDALTPSAPVRNPRAFLRTMAANLAADWLRHRNLRDVHAAPEASAANAPAVEPEPDQQLAARESFAGLLEAIEALSPRRREALLLYRFEGLSVGETARRMGVSYRTAETQIAGAVAFCMARLEDRGLWP